MARGQILLCRVSYLALHSQTRGCRNPVHGGGSPLLNSSHGMLKDRYLKGRGVSVTMRYGLVLGLLLALLSGCSSSTTVTQDPLALPTPTQQQANEPSPTPVSRQPEVTPTPSTSDVSHVKLVSLPSEAKLWFSLDYPEGWSVDPTLRGDSVQIQNRPLRILAQVEQLRETVVPKNAAELQAVLAAHATEVTVKQIEFQGSHAAFEAVRTYQVENETRRDLVLFLYGSTYMMTVTASAPRDLYPVWEPVFHQVLASVKPANLDAISRP